VIAVIGDLVEDIAVRVQSAVNIASDTQAVIVRRQGGSAANCAVAVARAGQSVRFIGQTGDDAIGHALTSTLREAGVQTAARHIGRTGTIVLLVDAGGERSMLTDRAACIALADPDPAWLDDVDVLHVPLYSLVGEPLATTTTTLIGWAHHRGIQVSVDTSSAAVIAERGVAHTLAELRRLRPDVLLCNLHESQTLGGVSSLDGVASRALVIKRGPLPAVIIDAHGNRTEISTPLLDGVADTTGAGDAFAAGFLIAWIDGGDGPTAVRSGHASARNAIALASGPA
jgi:sugar/nucleoside kinase (ribokinase family)